MAHPVIDVINLIVVVIVHLGCWYTAGINWNWWFRLRGARTTMRPYVLGVALANWCLLLFSFGCLLHILFLKQALLFLFFPFRFILMIAIFLHVYVTFRFKPPGGVSDDFKTIGTAHVSTPVTC